jgi:hypothetical protein
MSARLCIRLESDTTVEMGSLLKLWKRNRPDKLASDDGDDLKIIEYLKWSRFSLCWK